MCRQGARSLVYDTPAGKYFIWAEQFVHADRVELGETGDGCNRLCNFSNEPKQYTMEELMWHINFTVSTNEAMCFSGLRKYEHVAKWI